MSTQVGYRLRGIEPPDLAIYPDSVKLLWWGWVVEFGLEAKHRDLSRGLDKDGAPLRPLKPESIKHRKSEVGPTDRGAPPLQPSHLRSRVHSLLTGRAHVNSAEFWWRFDPVTGRSFAAILDYQREQGRDVFGLSPAATAWVRQQAGKRWEKWKRAAHVETRRAAMPGKRIVKQPLADRRPAFVIPLQGRTDLANMTAGPGVDIERTRRAIRAGWHTGFRRLNAEGEQWTPGPGVPAGPGGSSSPRPTPTQRRAVEKALAVPFRPAPRAALDRESTVLVDVRKLEDAWAAQQGRYLGRGATGAGEPVKYARFERWLLESRASGRAVEMPRAMLGPDGAPVFRDGAHRFAVFRDQGAAVVPMTVPRAEAPRFRLLFGASLDLLRSLVGLVERFAG